MISSNDPVGPATRTIESVRAASLTDKPFSRVSWGAIIAGALTALATQLIFMLIGIGVGLSTLDPGTSDNPSGTALGIGAAIWWLVTSLGSLVVGGFVAGRLAGNLNGYLHGLVTWATVTVATLMMLGTAAGGIMAGASGLGQLATSAAPAFRNQASGMIGRAQTSAEEAVNRAQAAAADPAARAQMEQTANRAAKGGAIGAFGAALTLILGAGAGGLAGRMGKRRFLSREPESSHFEAPART